jgi:CHAT domain-containing protein/tetratricopeptide (TPR) repeat protein
LSALRFLFLAGALSILACSRDGTGTGVTVESLGPRGAAARAGLRAGDVLLSWQRGAVGGALRSCADLAAVEMEQAPRGPVALRVNRRERTLSLTVAAGEWQVEVLPGDGGCAAFSHGRRLARLRRWSEAQAAYGQAAEAAKAAHARGGELFTALALQEQGTAALAVSDFPVAEKTLAAALRLRRGAAPGSLAEAAAWHALGRLHRIRGAIAPSEAAFHNALRLRQRFAPRSLDTATTLNNLGVDAWKRSDFDGAKAFCLQALALIRPLLPDSLEEAQVLNNLGLVTREAGDLDAAERYLVRAEQLLQRLDPQGEDLARTAVNLGTIASDRGDFARAEEYQRVALARFQRIAPDSLEVAKILNNLGINAGDRGDLAEADALFQRALAVCHRLFPGTEEEATSLSNLSWTARERGRLDEAEAFARQAFAIRSRQSPDGASVALSLAMLGGLASRRGDPGRAAALGRRALDLQQRIAPGSLYETEYLRFLADLALEQGEPNRAEPLARRMLAIRRRLAPQSGLEGEALDLLGLTFQRQGRLRQAEETLAEAAAAVESQIGRLSGMDEARAGFQARFGKIYRDLIELQVARGEPAAALHTLERSRARTLLALLAERDLAFAGDAPAALLQRQQRLDHEYEKAQQSLARLDPRLAAELDALLATLIRLRSERAALAARIARASPRYASLRSPQPLDLAGIRAVLDPGTVWLSYCVDEDRTFLFVVAAPPQKTGKPGVTVHTLPIGRQALAAEVATFRSLILRGREEIRPAGAALEPVLLAVGSRLYKLLVAPAAAAIARADRVLLSPDGPLHILPFAALVHGAPPVFLAEEKPWHSVLSATLYAEIRQRRRGPPAGAGPLVAFADPQVRTPAPGSRDDPREAPVRRYRNGLQPLPGARAEVRALAALWGSDAHVYIGAAASEQRLRELPVRPRYLHFACHALIDRLYPLDSALALATPAGEGSPDNGLLQAWEIFERLHLDSELVTLSACETGLGRDDGGEGLIGLTRAFQYAGARSVLASLWSVSDRTAAELMKRFYTLLRAGRPKDLALQEAQRALLHAGGSAAHPVHWAAFTLSGDWQ